MTYTEANKDKRKMAEKNEMQTLVSMNSLLLISSKQSAISLSKHKDGYTSLTEHMIISFFFVLHQVKFPFF